MKLLMLILSIFLASSILASETITVLETSLKENDLSSDAIFVLDREFESKNIFFSYNKDLAIISLKNSILVNKNHVHKVTDKRILRTLVHSPNLNRVDYRIRFRSSKLVKPTLNEIYFEKNKIIVKFFKSSKDMLLYQLQSKNKEKNKKEVTKKEKIKPTPKVKASKKNKEAKKIASITKDETSKEDTKLDSTLENKQEQKALIASPAPSSFNGTVLMVLLFLGAIAIYLKKKNPTVALANEGVKILSTKSLGNKKQLIMVEANGNKLLLATSENGVQVLSGSESSLEEESQLEYQPVKKESFKTNLDDEIDQLEQSFFQKKSKKNPYIQQQEEPEVVTHFSKTLKNIKKL